MLSARRFRYAHAALLSLALVLSSCGGGTSTAGVGGSGIGGTGITRIAGNVAQVVSAAPTEPRFFAGLMDLISTPANAQSAQLGGIVVSGGGQSTVTDGSGKFRLEDVTPSNDFVLAFMPQPDQSLSLPIGAVPAGSQVRVNNIVLNTSQGAASAGDIVVKQSSDDGNSNDDDDGDSNDDDTGDNDSMDDGNSDDDSTAN